jgi:dsRNA-specific ribonuclease
VEDWRGNYSDDLFKDSKSALQEALQNYNIELPRYNLIKTRGRTARSKF